MRCIDNMHLISVGSSIFIVAAMQPELKSRKSELTSEKQILEAATALSRLDQNRRGEQLCPVRWAVEFQAISGGMAMIPLPLA
jgi:hypothetical protein